jgi:hypothetical protein
LLKKYKMKAPDKEDCAWWDGSEGLGIGKELADIKTTAWHTITQINLKSSTMTVSCKFQQYQKKDTKFSLLMSCHQSLHCQ